MPGLFCRRIKSEHIATVGASRDKMISVIRKWLASHKTFQALKLAAHAVAQVGSRLDLKILAVLIEPEDAAAAEVLSEIPLLP